MYYLFSLFLFFTVFSLFGFKVNNDLKPRKISPDPLKYLCGYYKCQGHEWGEPDCSYIYENHLYFSSYRSPPELSTVEDIEICKKFFNNRNYIVTNEINNPNIAYEKSDFFNLHKMNRKYYFISSHGSKNGWVWFDENTAMLASEFPDMDRVKVALFSICYGGKRGNAAEYVTKYKGVKFSIGWDDTIRDDAARFFCYKFWEFHFKNSACDVDEALRETINYIGKKSWWRCGSYKTILNPILYKNDGTIKKYSYPLNKNNTNSNNFSYINGYKNFSYNNILRLRLTNYLGNDHISDDVVRTHIDSMISQTIFTDYNLKEVDQRILTINGENHLVKVYECHFKGDAECITPYYLDTHSNTLLDTDYVEQLFEKESK